MSAPTGENFSVKGKEYTIKPKVSSSNTLNAIKRVMKAQRRKEAKDALKDLEASLKDIPPDVVKEMRSALVQQFTNTEPITDDMAWEAIGSIDGLAAVLNQCCDGINSMEQAVQVIDLYSEENGTFYELVNLAMASTGLIEAKNFKNLLGQHHEEVDEKVEEAVAEMTAQKSTGEPNL